MKPNGWQPNTEGKSEKVVYETALEEGSAVLLFLCYTPALAGLPPLVCRFLLSFAFFM